MHIFESKPKSFKSGINLCCAGTGLALAEVELELGLVAAVGETVGVALGESVGDGDAVGVALPERVGEGMVVGVALGEAVTEGICDGFVVADGATLLTLTPLFQTNFLFFQMQVNLKPLEI